MRILHISWEYPPLVYGGLGRHVHALAEAQAALGHEVTVLTQQGPGASSAETVNGVSVIRVEPPTPEVPRVPDQLVEWTLELDARIASRAPEVIKEVTPDVIHGHDWVVARASLAARDAAGGSTPLVITIHATESGRHQGWINGDVSKTINAREELLATRADELIVCSGGMKTEVVHALGAPANRVAVIPNGIDTERWIVSRTDREDARFRWAPDGPLIVFVGRLEWEKGVHTLIDAVDQVRANHPSSTFVIAGTGTFEDTLHTRAADLADQAGVKFAGWLGETDMMALIAAGDLAVVPSLYEPFGLVALEAAALRTGLVVADTGGLSDIVTHGHTGLVFEAGDPESLAATIDQALNNPDEVADYVERIGEQLVHDFDWTRIAQRTVTAYESARNGGST